MKRIKSWKVIKKDVDAVTAFKAFKSLQVDDKKYEAIGIRHDYRAFQSDYHNIDNESFSAKELLSDKWTIMIPDYQLEQILANMRDMFKNEHFGNINYKQIDNMSINDLYNALMGIMQCLDETNKYRIAKHIIENKIYKKQ